ncbi:hypothetical protein PLEOSDRAFT_156634 [Pleurotus ostreatus PC15]|uniref:Uncharacterized protein n=1 Tax=Pleurotus ostreatus (strain PC15) TaxID=1137138 RepID=A0A067NXM8_PLEO1|nr:hypothetical protein PLEOSDRAFT_156634 [Pleurotus ostreatus PC15]
MNNLPHLSSLTLTNALAQPVGPAPSLSINLPSLTDLSITDNDMRNIAWMACITAPRIETIKLWCSEKQIEAEHSAAIVAAIYLNLPNLTDSHCQFALSLDTRQLDNYVCVVPGTSDLRLEESVLTLFPPTNVPPVLCFSSNATTFSDDNLTIPCQRILRQLTDVSEVHVSRLIDLPLIMCDTPNKRGQTTMSLPSWKMMVFCDSFHVKYKSRIFRWLKKQLKARKTVGSPIETWQLNSTNLESTNLEQFKDLVDCVPLVTKNPHTTQSWPY